MIQLCSVRGNIFWSAITHCQLPVFLHGSKDTDLRFLADVQKETILPSDQNDLVSLKLEFVDTQDYIRFVLAYLISEHGEEHCRADSV